MRFFLPLLFSQTFLLTFIVPTTPTLSLDIHSRHLTTLSTPPPVFSGAIHLASSPSSPQPSPEILPPAPPPFQEGAWTYQIQEENGRRTCILASRTQDGTFLVFRTIQNYGPDLTLVNPSWRLQGERLTLRVSIGPVIKDFPAILLTSQQIRVDLISDSESFADLLEAAELLVNPPIQVVATGIRPLSFSYEGLRATANRFGDCIETLHGSLPAPRR